jgi:DNA gyrase subunit B
LLLTFFYRQMLKLIENGRIYVARPPLYKVTQKKNVRYVQTAEEMNGELMKRGSAGTRLDVLSPQTDGQVVSSFEGERLDQLVRILDEIEGSVQILERRGHNLASFLARGTAAGLPSYWLRLGGQEYWFANRAEGDAFRLAEQQRLGRDFVVADESADHAGANGQTNGHGEMFSDQEFHEVPAINRGLERLRGFGLDASCLVETPRLAGREPLPRFLLHNGDLRRVLPNLRQLVMEIRRLGERGMSITRFKGLGEMDGEELWETTLDPQKRMLLKVQLDDAFKADEMFRILMGEKVEPRRDFIQKHALDVKDIDYHGA